MEHTNKKKKNKNILIRIFFTAFVGMFTCSQLHRIRRQTSNTHLLRLVLPGVFS